MAIQSEREYMVILREKRDMFILREIGSWLY